MVFTPLRLQSPGSDSPAPDLGGPLDAHWPLPLCPAPAPCPPPFFWFLPLVPLLAGSEPLPLSLCTLLTGSWLLLYISAPSKTACSLRPLGKKKCPASLQGPRALGNQGLSIRFVPHPMPTDAPARAGIGHIHSATTRAMNRASAEARNVCRGPVLSGALGARRWAKPIWPARSSQMGKRVGEPGGRGQHSRSGLWRGSPPGPGDLE